MQSTVLILILSCCMLPLLCTTACGAGPDLWLYQATNLQVDPNVDDLEKLWKRAAAAGYSHVLLADSKLARLGDLGDNTQRYMKNVARVRRVASSLKLEIVPAVFHVGYSNDLLWHDPNLAEGLPVKDSLFVVSGGRASLVADPAVRLTTPSFVDATVKLSGTTATVRDNADNARFVYTLTLPKFRCYHVSVSVRTQDYTGEPRVQVLAADKPDLSLQYQNLGVKRSQGWTEHHVVFNTLDHGDVRVYFGVWGAAKGTLEWRDWKVEEVGLLNVLRRDGTPLKVRTEEGRELVEGKDFDPVTDPKMGNVPWPGSYEVFHTPPTIKTRLPDGARLRVSWYHPALIYDGQVSVCPSDPKLKRLLTDEARRVHGAFGNASFLMSHDEIRTLNWDKACQDRHLTPGQILAENARLCTGVLKEQGGTHIYVWSDMFDPFHNAHADYYLVHGDLAGAWEGLDRSVTIVNWNFGKRTESLKFFADRGHRQVIAGYYDGSVNQIDQWLDAARDVKGVVGVMYTTWRNKYDDLERFATRVKGKK